MPRFSYSSFIVIHLMFIVCTNPVVEVMSAQWRLIVHHGFRILQLLVEDMLIFEILVKFLLQPDKICL